MRGATVKRRADGGRRAGADMAAKPFAARFLSFAAHNSLLFCVTIPAFQTTDWLVRKGVL